MIKWILRAGLGVIFFFVFFVFLLITALKFRLLAPEFWKTALDKGGVYVVLQDKMGELRGRAEASIKKEAGGRAIPKGLIELLSIPEQLGEERLRELIETNLDRLLGYLKGREKDLVLFLPVAEWNLPVAALGQPALLRLTGQTPSEQAMAVMGMKQEQVAETMKGLGLVKTIVGYLPIVWLGLLIMVLLTLAGHYFLGAGQIDRISGTAWLVMISGFIAKLVGVGAGKIFEMVASNSKPPMEAWIAGLGRSLVGQFFDLGATIGLVAGIGGLATVVAVVYLTKQGKLKEEKEKIGLIKKMAAFSLGAILGFAVLAGVLTGLALAFGGKVDFSTEGGSVKIGSQAEGGKATGETVKEEGQRLADEYYVSEKGWRMKFPFGWEVVKEGKTEGVIKKPVGSVTNWAMIQVSPLARKAVVDSGEYLRLFKESFAAGKAGLENGVLVDAYEEEQEETGLRRFAFVIDFDGTISGTKMRQRIYWVHFYPTDGGDGVAIMSKTPVETWGSYEKIIKESVDTFSLK